MSSRPVYLRGGLGPPQKLTANELKADLFTRGAWTPQKLTANELKASLFTRGAWNPQKLTTNELRASLFTRGAWTPQAGLGLGWGWRLGLPPRPQTSYHALRGPMNIFYSKHVSDI